MAGMTTHVLVAVLASAWASPFACQADLLDSPPTDGCLYPTDCFRHGPGVTVTTVGKCESRSKFRERYIHRANAEERMRMWKDRSRLMTDKILDAYEITDAQRVACVQVVDEYIANRRRVMANHLDEIRGLHRATIDRIREYVDAAGHARDGAPDAWNRMPGADDDPVLQELGERLQRLREMYPNDWGEFADRVEDVLPPEQARRGRERLAEQFPFALASSHGAKLASNGSETGNDSSVLPQAKDKDLDTWSGYLRQWTERYAPTPGQLTAAASVLMEVRARSVQLDSAVFGESAPDRTTGDQELTQRRREVLQLELDDLFEQFRTRLDALLTTAQRESPAGSVLHDESGQTP